MSSQPQTIAPFQTGLDTDSEPWLAPVDSFSVLENFHIRHGYVEKRGGYSLFGTLQKLDAAVAINAITNANPGQVTTAGHGYSTGDRVYISGAAGMTEVNDVIFTITVISPTDFTIGVNTTGYGVYGGGASAYKLIDDTDRVMGIFQYIDSANTKSMLSFNTTKANVYNETTEAFDILDAGAAIMSGAVTDYIWVANWQSSGIANRLYFTNGKQFDGASLDGIRYYNGTTTTTALNPSLNPAAVPPDTRHLYGGKLLFAIKQRLIVLNTYEEDAGVVTQYPQRARWCQAQNPTIWDDLTPGRGGFVDAPTGDHIISARQIQDSIIVFFTDSVWTLRPTSDPALPFRWDKINNFRACDSKMASVGYDRYVAALGIRGITATDGVETKRIDDRITDFVTDEISTDAFTKVYCARSYANKRWWTLYPSVVSTEIDSALIYDDDSKAFSTYKIAMNCLGYGSQGYDYELGDFVGDKDFAIEDFNDETLLSFYWQSNQELFLGGDITGNVYILETTGSDDGSDIDSQLFTAGWNPYRDTGQEATLMHVDVQIDTDQNAVGFFEFYKDDQFTRYGFQNFNFLPDLNFVADIIAVTQANPAQVTAPDHGLATGDVIYIYGIKGMIELSGGPFTVTVVDTANFTLDGIDSTAYTAYTNGGNVVLKSFYKTKTWKRVSVGGTGYVHRLKFVATGNNEPFRIHAFRPYFKPRGRRTVNS